ncbi:MAG: AMP-binding protein [Polyangiaceae bacterium]
METPFPISALAESLRRAEASPFHRERLRGRPIRSLADLSRVPLMTRQDLSREGPRGLVCVPEEELSQYHESSGTTGEPVPAWYSRRDLAEIRDRLSRWGVGFSPGDRVLVRFPYALSTVAHFVHAAAQHAGACVIPAGSRTPITPLARVVEMLRRLDVTVLCTISLGAVMIAEAAEGLGLDPRRDFPHLRAIGCAGEPLSPHRRELLEELWRVPVFDNYGTTETGPLAVACREGRLHPWRDLFHFELLDERLEGEARPGQTGMLVVTALSARAMPLVRYVTGDRAALVGERCGCGGEETLRVRGRAEETVRIGGHDFDQWELSDIVARLPCRRFWRAFEVPGGLRFVVERERPDDRVHPGLLAELSRDHGVNIDVEISPKGTLYDRSEPVSFGMRAKPVYVQPVKG